MSCGGCVNSLTRVLKTVPGIEPLKIEVGKAPCGSTTGDDALWSRPPSSAPDSS